MGVRRIKGYGLVGAGGIPVSLLGTSPHALDGIDWLLLARFNVGDQGYANGQVLGPAEGVDVGQLTVTELDGVAQCIGQLLRLSSKTINNWGQLGVHSPNGINRVLGRCLLSDVEDTTSGTQMVAWHNAAALSGTTAGTQISTVFDGGVISKHGVGIPLSQIGAYAVGTVYQLALVLGGYDINGVPWHSGAVGSFIYGASIYIINGAYSAWTLLWRDTNNAVVALYPQVQLRTLADTFEIDDFRVPDVDLSAVLQPINKSTFDAPNGTSLDAITPEVGGVWTEQNGNWDIQSNRANTVAPDPGVYLATVDAGVSDCWIRATVNINVAGGVVFRFVDSSNYWFADIVDGTNQFRIVEVSGGGGTPRATAAVSITAGTDYDIVVTLDGQSIVAYLDGATRISHTSSSFLTATLQGMRGQDPTDRFDNFHIHARTSSTYDLEFGAVP